jgi:hypothetical protein
MLYYNWNRYYIPSVGRYSSFDFKENLKRFEYSGNNPVNNYDISGCIGTEDCFLETGQGNWLVRVMRVIRTQYAPRVPNFGCGLGWFTEEMTEFYWCPKMEEEAKYDRFRTPHRLMVGLDFLNEGWEYQTCIISHEICHAKYGECEAYESSYNCSKTFGLEEKAKENWNEGCKRGCSWTRK